MRTHTGAIPARRGRRTLQLVAALLAVATVAAFTGSFANGASSNTTVSVTVASATNIDASGCIAGTANVTDIGTVLPNTTTVTPSNCAVTFGSSNDTSQLRIAQTDALGNAIWMTTRGALDTSFDTDGLVTTATAPGTNNDIDRSLVVQGDGKVVTAGYCDMGGATGIDVCLARYNTDGSLDTTFDTDGLVTTATAPTTNTDYALSVVVQADGRFVAAGYCGMGGATGWDACLARYNTDGSLDTSFDTDGRVTTATAPTTNFDAAYSVAVQTDGKLVTAGYCNMGGATGFDSCLARYNADGSLDTTFDTDGRVTTATGPGTNGDYAWSIAVQGDGKIVTAGYCDMGGATGNDACLARYNADGSLDATFDTDGRVTTATSPGTYNDYAYSVVVQADGKIGIL